MHKGIELVGFTSYLFTFQYSEAYLSRDILLVFVVWGCFFFSLLKFLIFVKAKVKRYYATTAQVGRLITTIISLPYCLSITEKKNLSHKTSLHLICVQVHCHTEVWSLTAGLKLFVVFQSTSVITDMTPHSFMSVLRIFCMFKKKS